MGDPVLSLDLDGVSEKIMCGKLGILRVLFPDETILSRKSASGEGYHILVYTDMRYEDEIQYRRLLGDDEMRIMFDLNRHVSGIPEQVLFDEKIRNGKVMRSEHWEIYIKNPGRYEV
jgi:pyruvate formate-lyase activating enzyme-like uncharacterized protein